MLRPGKVLVIYGPRQVGETTLINSFLENFTGRYYLGSGEDLTLREIMESNNYFWRTYDRPFLPASPDVY